MVEDDITVVTAEDAIATSPAIEATDMAMCAPLQSIADVRMVEQLPVTVAVAQQAAAAQLVPVVVAQHVAAAAQHAAAAAQHAAAAAQHAAAADNVVNRLHAT